MNNYHESNNQNSQTAVSNNTKHDFHPITQNWLWSLYLKPVFISSWILLIILSYFYIDQPLAIYLNHFFPSFVYKIGHFVTLLGTGSVNFLIAGIFLAAGFAFKSRKLIYFALFLLIALLTAALVCDILKITLGRARPSQLFIHGYYGFYFMKFKSAMWSFPSGHAVLISTTATAISLRWPRYQTISILMVLIIAASRIILEHHYLSDVLTGVLLGSGLTLLVYRQLCRYPRWSILIVG